MLWMEHCNTNKKTKKFKRQKKINQKVECENTVMRGPSYNIIFCMKKLTLETAHVIVAYLCSLLWKTNMKSKNRLD